MIFNWRTPFTYLFFYLIIIASGGILSGCSTNNSGSAPDLSIQIQGHAIDALIEAGTVTAYAFNTGQKGTVLGSAQTDSNGLYSLTLKSYSGPVYFELRGGSYMDEATGTVTSLSGEQYLSTIQNIEGGNNIGNLMITPLTTIASSLAEAKINRGATISSAIDEANSDMTRLFGINVVTALPLSLTERQLSFSDSSQYGLILAGLSQMASQISEINGVKPGQIYTSIKLADTMAMDASDGILDGKQNGIPLILGSYSLDSYNYRSKLGEAAVLFLSNPRNQSGLGWKDVISSLKTIAATLSPLFPETDSPRQIDQIPPVISFNLQDKTAVNKEVKVIATATDESGIASITLVPDIPITPKSQGQTGDPSTTGFVFDSTRILDGEVVFTAIATDRAGNRQNSFLTLRISNTPPVLNMTLPTGSWVNQPDFNMTGTVIDNSKLGIASVIAGTVPATMTTSSSSGTTFSATVRLTPGNNIFDITATDELGNITTIKDYTLILDSIPPVISVSPPSYFDEAQMKFSFRSSQIVYSLPASTTTIDLTNASINKNQARLSIGTGGINTGNLSSSNLPYYKFTVNDPGSPSTPPNNLQVLYSFLQQKKGSTTLTLVKDFGPAPHDPDNIAGNGYLIPISVETLDPVLAQTDSSTLNLITVKAMDWAGNITFQDYTFYINLLAPPLYAEFDTVFLTNPLQGANMLPSYNFTSRLGAYNAGELNVGKIKISNFSPVSVYFSTTSSQNTGSLTLAESAEYFPSNYINNTGSRVICGTPSCANSYYNNSYPYHYPLNVKDQSLFNQQTNNPLSLQSAGYYIISPGESDYFWVTSNYASTPYHNDTPRYQPGQTCFRTDTSVHFSHNLVLDLSSASVLTNNNAGNFGTVNRTFLYQTLDWPGNPAFTALYYGYDAMTCLP